MNLSVLYLVNIPSPYRVSFFNELGLECDLTVIFEREKSPKREESWHAYNFDNFNGVFLNGFNVIEHLNNERYDVIVLGNYSTPTGMLSNYVLNRNNIPFIINVDGGLINYEERKIKYSLKKKLMSNASAWLSTGEFTNEYLTYYGANRENIHIYPFTTMKKENILEKPLTNNEKKDIRHELHIPYKNMILSVGSFNYRKGFDVLITAAKDFKEDTGVYIIGGKPTEEYFKLIDRYDIKNVHFIDFLDYDKLKKYYLAANIFVFPTREDVWGLVINEAMANGLPVITTTSCVAGMEMLDEGVNGYLVPKDDVESIVKTTNHILNNQVLQQKMSGNNLKKANNYTIENMAKITINSIYDFKRQYNNDN